MDDLQIKSGATEPQLRFHNSDARFRALVSGVGAGKTWAGVIELLRQPAGSVGAVIAPTFRMLKDTTMRTFMEIADKSKGLVESFSKSDLTMTLVDEKQILFRSSDEPDKLRGPNLGWFWLDEAAMMDPQTWEIMIGRLRLDPGRAWVTTTPRGKANWVYKIFVRDPARDAELAADMKLVQCSTRTNTYLPDYFADNLNRRYTGAFLQQELDGSFVDFGQNLAYNEYKQKLNDAPDFPTDGKQTWSEENYDRRAPLYVCCDFNVAIMSWPVLQIHGVQPCVLTEITTIGRATIAQQCLSLRTRYPDHAGPVLVYGDASGAASSAQTGLSYFDLIQKELQDHYTDLTIVVPPKNPRVVTRILNTNALIRGATPWKPLLISRHECPILVRDFEECMLDESGEDLEKIRTPTDERYYLTHASDALGYFACLEVPLADRHDPPPTDAEIAATEKLENEETGHGLWGL